MSLKELVASEVETLSENDLRALAEYLSFLKFRARASPHASQSDADVAALYAEFEREDRELANAGLEDYAGVLAREDRQ